VRLPLLRTRRIAFGLFAGALFVGTHIPNLRVNVATIQRPDLVIHLLAFGGWFAFLLVAEFVGPWRSTRSIGLCALIAGAYAIMDEYSQTIPLLGRTAAFDDLTANLSGIVLTAIGALVLARLWRPRPAPPLTPAAPGSR